MTKALSKAENQILKHIALHGFKTKYDLSVKDRVAADSTVWKAMEKLENLGFIDAKHKEPFQKIPGKIKTSYGLTFRGLVQALKIEGVRLHLIKNNDRLIASWIQTVKNIDSDFKIRQMFGVKKDFSLLENSILDYMRQNPEDIEAFLKHYDLDYSDNGLIYSELIFHVTSRTRAHQIVNRFTRRQLERADRKIPESWKEKR